MPKDRPIKPFMKSNYFVENIEFACNRVSMTICVQTLLETEATRVKCRCIGSIFVKVGNNSNRRRDKEIQDLPFVFDGR